MIIVYLFRLNGAHNCLMNVKFNILLTIKQRIKIYDISILNAYELSTGSNFINHNVIPIFC